MNGEALYSVKWYKDGFEFYRYVPRDHPPAQVFIQNGIDVDVSIFGFKVLKHLEEYKVTMWIIPVLIFRGFSQQQLNLEHS